MEIFVDQCNNKHFLKSNYENMNLFFENNGILDLINLGKKNKANMPKTFSLKQTLAGLFHDIATPVFKHCIDFMNGDSETQESTEEKTSDIIRNSSKIMFL